MNDSSEGVRLSKRVAALAGVSRREAELLIENGSVSVDGVTSTLPQSRVHDHQKVAVTEGAEPKPLVEVTLLLHKPAGIAADAAHQLFIATNHHEPEFAGQRFVPAHLKRQRLMTPLETGASGLIAFTQEFRIERKLQADAGIIEHEVMVDVEGVVSPEVLARLERSPARVSIGRQTENQTGLRFALKGARPGQIADICDHVGLRIMAMRRIRIGRVSLAGLAPGQWRYLSANERF